MKLPWTWANILILSIIAFIFIHASETALADNKARQFNLPLPAVPYEKASIELVVGEKLSLADVLQFSARNFPSIKAAHARLKSATEEIALAKTEYIPSVNIFSQTNAGNINKLPGVLFPQLGTLPIQGFTPNNPSYRMAFGTWDGALITWDIYDFGLRRSKVERARVNRNYVYEQEYLTLFDITVNAAQRFMENILALEYVKAAKANLERARIFFEVVTALVDNGLRPGVDKVRAGTDFIKAQTQVIQAENQLEIANNRLSVSMGLAGQKIPLDIAPFNERIQNPPDNLMTQQIPASHPLLALQKRQIELAKAKQKVYLRSYFPKISLWGA